MSTSPKKSEKSKSKDKVKDKQKEKQKSVKDKPKQKDKDTKSKKSKGDIKQISSQVQLPSPSTLLPAPSSLPLNLLPLLQPPPHICSFHNQPNYSFCQTCQQLACHQCSLNGPHQSQLHKIVTVQQCYRNRYLYLKQLIYNDLLRKRDELKDKLESINDMVEELKYNKQGVEREINKEFNGVLERLRVAYGGKLAVLYNAMAEIQRQLEILNNVGDEFFKLTNLSHNESAETNPKGLVPFLLRSRHLQDEAENLIAYPVNEEVRVNPYDLPRQVQQKKLLIEKAKQSDPAKDFKHEVIYSLLREGQFATTNLENLFQKQANSQKAEWMKMVNQLKDQLSKFNKICHFCGVGLNSESVNGECFKNVEYVGGQGGYCLGQPPTECVGNRYHYFDRPA